MRELHYYVACSIDGFIAETDGTFNRFVSDGPSVKDYLQALTQFSAVLMGRKTYEVGLKHDVSNPYPHLDSYLFSTTMTKSPDPAVTLVRSDSAEKVRQLKRADGLPIYLCGGGILAAQMIQEKLVDKIILKINPLVLGNGIPLFGKTVAPQDLKLEKQSVYSDGCCWLYYQVLSE